MVSKQFKKTIMAISQTEFEKLPENEQAFRWKLFVESNGYQKDLSKKEIEEIAKQYGVTLN